MQPQKSSDGLKKTINIRRLPSPVSSLGWPEDEEDKNSLRAEDLSIQPEHAFSPTDRLFLNVLPRSLSPETDKEYSSYSGTTEREETSMEQELFFTQQENEPFDLGSLFD